MSAEKKHPLLSASCSILLFLLLFSADSVSALEANGELSGQGFLFLEDAAWAGQRDMSVSAAATLELYHDLTDNLQFTMEAFYRVDSQDANRSHGDLRYAEFLYFTDNWETGLGMAKVFWGATEFVHLVDIINQTDQVEALDGEEKLGQPMLHVTVPRDWGVVEGFVMPWFRERTFPGKKGRFRTPIAVDTDRAVYESGAEQHHTDLAVRYSTSIDNADIGLYHFTGTAREPVLLLSLQEDSSPILYPYYEQIGQSGLDIQMVAADWLFKLEALYRTGQSRSYAATTFGFEYSFIGIANSMMDLGVLGEYVFDDRDQGWLPTIYDNDIMAGLRLVVNDMDDSTLLVGLIRDLQYGSSIIAIESSRRIGDSVRLNIDASFFINLDREDPAFSLARDDYISLEVVWYW